MKLITDIAALASASIVLAASNNLVNGFQNPRSPSTTQNGRGGRFGLGWVARPFMGTKLGSSTETLSESTESATDELSWDSFEAKLSSAEDGSARDPVLTLYRDTNGWCPFCERVWVCIRAKDLPYQERLIALFDKPEWYKEMVPTTQVPAVLFHEWDGDDSANSRKLVWESADIMKALDEAFPDTVQLVHDTEEYKAAEEAIAQITKLGFEFSRAQSNSTCPAEELKEKRQAFLSALDQLDQSLEASGGPFRLGSEFSGIDALMVPLLERWRYQLPLKSVSPVDMLEGRPFVQKWFEGMESYAPYSDRVMGDRYSWVGANALFVNYFGGTDEEIAKSENTALELIETFKPESAQVEIKCEERFALEAARKIVGNHEGIVKDCSNKEPKSQKFIIRSQDEDNADHVLQFAVQLLLEGDDAISSAFSKPITPALEDMSKEQKDDAAMAAKTVASRLCVPRDMSAPAANILRAVLMIVSDRLTE